MSRSMTTEDILFALLRSEICGEPVSQEVKVAITQETLKALWEVSNRHGVPHIAGQALSKEGLLKQDEVSQKFQKKTMDAVSVYIHMSHVFHSVCQALEAAQISFIPLKGMELQRWYPEPWLRQCSDIDILVQEENVEAAARVLEEKLGCTRSKNGTHDISFVFTGGVSIELHFMLIEETVSEKQQALLCRIWEVARPIAGNNYRYAMPWKWFLLYHLSHMAKHITRGDCPIKLFADLVIIDRMPEAEPAEKDLLLEEAGLAKFYAMVQDVVNYWFFQVPADAVCKSICDFVLGGPDMKFVVRRTKKGGRLRYVIHRIFKPYTSLKAMYPVLEKHKWMYPLCQIHRWLRILTGKKQRAQTMREIKGIDAASPEEIEQISFVLKQLELQ